MPPGQFNADWIEMLIANMAKTENKSPTGIRTMLKKRNPASWLGEIGEFGFAYAKMCNAHSGYLKGQNILIVGGSFSTTT
ncbi:MAG: hypothetical protein CMM73_04040 [Rhodospirillaceae bacterium]|nr:hypothetical protein [Rhodospirillaceae bacterium]